MANLLMRIEATSRALRDAHAALASLRKSTLMHSFRQLLADPAVRRVPVGQVGEVLLGRQRAPQHEDGPSMRPYLRAANVFDGYIDTADVKSMNFSPSEYRRYALQDGDVLLVEGNSSRAVVGKSAIFRGELPGACFQNTLVRFRPEPEVLTPYAHQYFRYCVHGGTFAAVARQTSIAHLGAQNLAALPIPLPGKSRQLELSKRLSAMNAASRATPDREQRLRSLKATVSETLCRATTR